MNELEMFRRGPDEDRPLIDRVELAIGRVTSGLPADEATKLSKALRDSAKSAGMPYVLVTLSATPAPVPPRAVIELTRAAVEAADDVALDVLLADELAARAGGKGTPPVTWRDVVETIATGRPATAPTHATSGTGTAGDLVAAAVHSAAPASIPTSPAGFADVARSIAAAL